MALQRRSSISFRDVRVEAELAVRAGNETGTGLIASRDLDRYYHLLAAELAVLELTTAEACAIADVLNGSLHQVEIAPPIHWEFADALDEGIAEKWQIDGASLFARLKALTPGQRWAIADAAERWWTSTTTQPELDHEARCRLVGLSR